MRADMVRAYIETLLERLTGSEKLTPDADGDYPVRYKSSLYYVRLIGSENPVVQVFATAVSDVPSSPALYERINEINAQIRFARIFWVREQVLIESDHIGQTIDPEEFDTACEAVGSITDHFGPLLAKEFGGKSFFAETKEEPPKEAPTSTGLYL